MARHLEINSIKRFFEVIWLITLVTTAGTVLLPTISVRLETLDQQNLSLIFHNESVLTVPTGVNRLIVECSANYPVMWNLAESEINFEMYHWMTIRSQRVVINMFDSTTFNYSTQLLISSPGSGMSNKLTGNYFCQSTIKRDVQKSILMLWEGAYLLIHSKEKLTRYVENSRVTLPCDVSSLLGKTPKLMKEPVDKKSAGYQFVGLNDSISYDPRKGFTLADLPFPTGRYKCTFGTGDDDLVVVNVRQVAGSNLTTTKSNASFEYNSERREFRCCSRTKKPPRLYTIPCSHPSTCQIREHVLSLYESIISRFKTEGNCVKTTLRNFHAGLIRCTGDGIDEYKEVISPIEIYFRPWNSKVNSSTFFSWEEIEPQEMLTVKLSSERFIFNETNLNKPKTVLFSDQDVRLTCRISSYYFSDGIKWAIKWKNGSLTFPSAEEKAVRTQVMYAYMPPTENALSFKANLNMDAVICFAPVWNSSVWIPKIYFLHVNESIKPTLMNPQIEKREWYTNETKKELLCEGVGKPKPSITWKKNDQILSIGHNYKINEINTTKSVTNTSTVSSTLQILIVSYSTHGEYSCLISNYGGSTVKKFQITVLEKSSSKTWIVLVILGAVICILIGATMFFYKKFQQDKQAIAQINSSAFNGGIASNGNHSAHVSFDNGTLRSQLIK